MTTPLPPDDCLNCIKKAYFASSHIDDDDMNVIMDGDEKSEERISKVEEKLMILLDKDDGLDAAKVLAKARRASLELSNPTRNLSGSGRFSIHIEPNPPSNKPVLHLYPCSSTFSALPSHPSVWPQAPLMIRPSPNSTTKIRGIRKMASVEYRDFPGFCAGCILPINSGREAPGESLVIDFESTHFVGTMLMRIKQVPENLGKTQYQKASYFDGKKRKFQAIVKGRFKTQFPMCEAVTGQMFERPAGKLPARWIVSSFIKFVSTLAPQLEVQLDTDTPRFLAPLVATAHTVQENSLPPENDWRDISEYMCTNMEDPVEEPPSTDPSSVIPAAEEALGISKPTDTTKMSVANRMKTRKRIFNSIAAKKETSLHFQTDKEYTFEFYQHLLDFGEEGLALDMGRPIGKIGLSQATDGQPLKFMSAHKDPNSSDGSKDLDTLWSFDMWHASLYPYAEMALHDDDEFHDAIE